VTINASLDAIDEVLPFASGEGSSPSWVKRTVAFDDLAAASPTNDIELYSLPAGGMIHAVKLKHSTAFAGGSLSAYVVSVGIAGDLDKYMSGGAFDVFQAVSGTAFQVNSVVGAENNGAAASIRISATATGDDLDAATAGVVDVWLLVSFPV
jgi:hypothetical protein